MHGMKPGRRLRAVVLAWLVLAVTASCVVPSTSGRAAHTERPDADTTPTRAAPATRATSATAVHSHTRSRAPAVTGADLTAAVHAVSPSVTLGAIVYDRRRGRKLLAVQRDRQFPSASMVKLLIAIDTLRRSPAAGSRVTRMLTYSNNKIASALWAAGGGTAIVRRTAARIGLRDAAPPRIPSQWGSTLLSARDVAAIYRYILTELPAGRRELIVHALAATSRRAADGTDQYFGIPSAFDRPWAIKQGWGSTARKAVLHSTGLVGEKWRYIVVLLTEHPRPARWPRLRTAVTTAARTTEPLVS